MLALLCTYYCIYSFVNTYFKIPCSQKKYWFTYLN